jgi:hypothetical protein
MLYYFNVKRGFHVSKRRRWLDTQEADQANLSLPITLINSIITYLKILIISAQQDWMMIINGKQGSERIWECAL